MLESIQNCRSAGSYAVQRESATYQSRSPARSRLLCVTTFPSQIDRIGTGNVAIAADHPTA